MSNPTNNNESTTHERKRNGPPEARLWLAHHHHEPPRPAQRAQSGHDARAGGSGAARGGGSRGARGAVEGRRRHLLRRRRRQVDGGGQGAARLRGQDGQSAPRHGSVADPASDAEARGGAGRWRRCRRRPLDRAVLRPAYRQRLLQDHHGVCQGGVVRRLRRNVLSSPRCSAAPRRANSI